MDAKNDDSAGSDSLDKTLQKKCVVDDMGQGEGGSHECDKPTPASDKDKERERERDHEKDKEKERQVKKKLSASLGLAESDELPGNSTKKQKTEKSVGDGGSAVRSVVSGSGSGASGSGASATSNRNKNASKTHQMHEREASVSALSSRTDDDIQNSTQAQTNTASSSVAAAISNSASSTSNINAFETKVTQISKDLKETSLAESETAYSSVSNSSPSPDTEDGDSSSSPSTPTSTSSSPLYEDAASGLESALLTVAESATPALSAAEADSHPSVATRSVDASDNTLPPHTETDEQLNVAEGGNESADAGGNESLDEIQLRSKKVRFHPDVKENDGGKRVKKKKSKTAHGCGDEASTSAAAQRSIGGNDDEMDLDETEEDSEEEEFDLAKTIAEAQDYLKTHPLTFASAQGKSGARLQNGLLGEEDMNLQADSSEDEDVFDKALPENGVERIVGKQIKCGKVEYLLRYTDRPGLFWETDEFIMTYCPNMLHLYEVNRERRQERLMRHVAKRQNVRQRYTDF